MALRLNPYLSFQNNARDAMTFYQSVFGGELTISTFAEFPDMNPAPEDQDKIMHSQLETADGFTIMASDTPPGMQYQPQAGVSISVSGEDQEKLRGYWEQLSTSGSVIMPFELAPWGDLFGMCADGFGTNWMVSSSPE